jgi:hypothetical protein
MVVIDEAGAYIVRLTSTIPLHHTVIHGYRLQFRDHMLADSRCLSVAFEGVRIFRLSSELSCDAR